MNYIRTPVTAIATTLTGVVEGRAVPVAPGQAAAAAAPGVRRPARDGGAVGREHGGLQGWGQP